MGSWERLGRVIFGGNITPRTLDVNPNRVRIYGVLLLC